ncbi:MAG: ankyrin repeat domain-containing protein [Alphaproteobacteria bacterium]|nr:ankyrin repeat domain-containing protein [Alphaproteobacteria bacterium]
MDKLNRWNKSWGKVDWNKNSDELIEQKIIDFHNAGIDFNMEKDNATGLTPLHLAALYGRAKLIKPLIDFGADPDAEAYMGNGLNYKTPLMLASGKGHNATVKELIKCGAHVNYKTVNNFSNGRATALAYAVLYGHPETVKLLIEAGACEIKSALSVESEKNNAKIKKLLENADKIRIAYLEEQANVKKAVKQKLKNQKQLDSQLHTAATYGDLNKVKTLVARGANVNSKNASNQTAVMMAVAKNHANVANFLVENGANVNLKDSDGKSALLNAVLADRVELIDTLIKHGADMYEKIDADGNSLLHIAVKENCTKSIKALLKNGFDEYTANETGDMALHTAAVI